MELPEPPESNIGQAARAVADVFGCPYEEAVAVLRLGIDARIAEQNEPRAEQEPRLEEGDG